MSIRHERNNLRNASLGRLEIFKCLTPIRTSIRLSGKNRFHAGTAAILRNTGKRYSKRNEKKDRQAEKMSHNAPNMAYDDKQTGCHAVFLCKGCAITGAPGFLAQCAANPDKGFHNDDKPQYGNANETHRSSLCGDFRDHTGYINGSGMRCRCHQGTKARKGCQRYKFFNEGF